MLSEYLGWGGQRFIKHPFLWCLEISTGPFQPCSGDLPSGPRVSPLPVAQASGTQAGEAWLPTRGPGPWFCAPGSQGSEFPGESLVFPEMLRRTRRKWARGAPAPRGPAQEETALLTDVSLPAWPRDVNCPLLWGIYVSDVLHAIGLREFLLQGPGGHIYWGAEPGRRQPPRELPRGGRCQLSNDSCPVFSKS